MTAGLQQAAATPAPYLSFWQGGYEGADHVNGSGVALCMNRATRHHLYAGDDYRRAARRGLRTVRESVGWRHVERDGGFDFGFVGERMQAAREVGVQILWTCFHFGVPHRLDLFSPAFVPRLARYCGALARYLKPFHADGPPAVYTPINEISFLAWAACETGLIHPHRGDRAHDGYAFKRHLVRAALAAADAIRDADPAARILAVDPLIHVAPAADDADAEAEARRQNECQFQAYDMLCGRLDPDLGGAPEQLDLIGANYYPHNQWEARTRATLQWPHDPRRRPLAALLGDLYARYRRPITLSETSHIDAERGPWIIDVAQQVAAAHAGGVDVAGICLYPLLDRPDWEQPDDWHRSGLWRIAAAQPERRIDVPYAMALARARALLPLGPSPTPARGPGSHADDMPALTRIHSLNRGAPWTH